MESAPKYGVVLALGYASQFEEGFAERVELTLVVDYVGFVAHAFLGVLAGEVQQLLF